MFASGDKVKKGSILCEWNPHASPILAERSGTVKFKDIEVGATVREDKRGDKIEVVVTEHRGDRSPQILIVDGDGKVLDFHHLPAKARLEVKEGDAVQAGQMVARQPKDVAKSADIVGGLPRVTEIFEARIPKDPAILAKISGTVRLEPDRRKGKMTIVVESEGLEEVHLAPQGKALMVHTGDYVDAGDRLTDGPLVPSEVLAVKGDEALYEYMLGEVQNVYRAQGVPISDTHIEVILRQMMSKIRIQNPGDTTLLPNEVVDRWVFCSSNDDMDSKLRVIEPGDTGYRWRADRQRGPQRTQRAHGGRWQGARQDQALQAGFGPNVAWHHQGLVAVRVVLVGGFLPGNHQGAYEAATVGPPTNSLASRKTSSWVISFLPVPVSIRTTR